MNLCHLLLEMWILVKRDKLTSYNIKLPSYKVFNATEKAICGQSTAHKGKERERPDSQKGELD